MTSESTHSNPEQMPALFLAHGSPLLLTDSLWIKQLGDWAKALSSPKAILMLSAHWVDSPITMGATETVPLVYDFYGFPKQFYQVTYPSPGAPELAQKVRGLLSGRGPIAQDPRRGLDHGAFVPLMAMYPKADIPVLQMSLPSLEPETLFTLGRALAPLRKDGVLIMGSGFLTHNLRMIDWNESSGVPAWAKDFDSWTAEVLAKKDVDSLLQYRKKAPGVQQALPTHEHFVPVITALGASIDSEGPVSFPITGFTYGSFTKRSVQYG